jgi:beta-lactamase superfamily II metal-dependent hydrolase
VGGAFALIENMGIGQVIVPDYSRESRHMERFAAAMDGAGLVPYILKETLRFTLDGADFIVDPSGLEYFHFPRRVHEPDIDIELDEADDPLGDNFSIVVAVSHGENHFLFTGDALNQRLDEVLQNETLMALAYTFLKIPRHGRHTPGSVALIQALNPRYAVITGFSPEQADEYHPARPADERIIAALENAGAEVFFAMDAGVYAVSDGVGLEVTH